MLFEFDVRHLNVGVSDKPSTFIVFVLDERKGAVTKAIAGEFAAVRSTIDIFRVDLYRGIWYVVHFYQVGSLRVGLDRLMILRDGIVLSLETSHAIQIDLNVLYGVPALIGDFAFNGEMGRGEPYITSTIPISSIFSQPTPRRASNIEKKPNARTLLCFCIFIEM